MTIAVTGATGQLGRLALTALQPRAGGRLLALARDPARATNLGLPVRAFDYAAPDRAALEGVQVLVLISSNDMANRAGQHERVVQAAQAAGVGRVVYTSLLRAGSSAMRLAADHRVTEAAIRAAGLPFTLLRNGWYTENHTAGLAGALAAGGLIGASGAGRIAAATRADYAEAIAVAATGAGHEGQVYELAGDDAFAMADFAAELSRLTGRSTPYTDLPEAEYARILTGFGLPAGFAAVLADADARAAQGALYDDSRTLSRLIGRPTTPWQQTLAAAVAALG